MTKNALVIFIKNPLPGKVKTRLAAHIGNEKALCIYLAVLHHVRQVALVSSAERYVYYSDEIETSDDWLETDFIKRQQQGENIGERMAHAIRETLAIHEKVILVGGDLPQLTGEIIQEAFDRLDAADFVLGPTLDGGYYLIGMKKFQPEVFDGIKWSTATVFYKTIKNIEALDMTFAQMPILPDVDTIEDWEAHGWEL